MAPTSAPKNSKDLAIRLKEKKEQDRLLIRQEVENVVLNLKNNSQKSANTIRSDIEKRAIRRWTQTLAWISGATLIVVGALCMILWDLTSEIAETKSALAQSKVLLMQETQRIAQREKTFRTANGLAIVTDKSGGIWLQVSPGLTWGQTLKSADGTTLFQILGR